jgi:DNA-nicking Smr family endonuclease
VHRPLTAEERALWAKVIATVRPLHQQPEQPASATEPVPSPSPAPAIKPAPPRTKFAPKPVVQPGETLDGTWDRRLSRGSIQPDLSVDLHGHNLANAYDLLDRKLESAIAMESRVVLLITGKPPSEDRRPVARGAIRAAVGDWLAASRHAANIAAVRGAHPRHGGQGAIYIVLRRQRGSKQTNS